jgi:hypothetical protein
MVTGARQKRWNVNGKKTDALPRLSVDLAETAFPASEVRLLKAARGCPSRTGQHCSFPVPLT